MIKWWKQRSSSQRLLVYAVALPMVFVIAMGAGAMTVLFIQGDSGLVPRQSAFSPPRQQVNPPHGQRAVSGHEQQQGADVEQAQTTYVSTVGEIQNNAVAAFLDTHEKLVRYDALTADDVEKIQANQSVLQEYMDQVDSINPPQKYKAHYKVFRLSIKELQSATQLAYMVVADPTAATQSAFEEYDHRVSEAAVNLQKSNEMLDRGYKTINGVQEVSQ